jgi:hypothetical protein
MSKFIRFGEIIINYTDLVWVGIFPSSTILSFQFSNPGNNFTLRYNDHNSAISAISAFEMLLRGASPNLVYPPLPILPGL